VNSPAPWYVVEKMGAVSILDVQGHRVCDLAFQDNPDTLESNALCIKLAPQLLVSLRMAIHALDQDGTHEDMVRHLQRYVDAATYTPYSDIVQGKGAA